MFILGSIHYEGDVTEAEDPTALEVIEMIKNGLLDGSLEITTPDGTILEIDPDFIAAYILCTQH